MMFPTLAAEPIAPATFVKDTPASIDHASAVPAWVSMNMVWWVAAIVIGVAIVALAWRLMRNRQEDPCERAWRCASKRLRLTDNQRDLCRRLADIVSGERSVKPIVLLLSQDTFLRAADTALQSRAVWAQREELAALQRVVFEPRPGDAF